MIRVVDRVPTYPNRIKITRADGTSEYVTWERADEPTEVGTPINKALFDSIAADMGLAQTTTLYVSTSGSDALGNGTAANPYATIQKAIDSLPKNLNGHDVVISIAEGTYDEDVYVSRTFGGVLNLDGIAGTTVSIRSLRVVYGAIVQVQNINLNVTGSIFDSGIGVTNAYLLCTSAIKIINGSPIGVYMNMNALCYFASLEISNTTSSAIFSTNNSSAYVASLTGINNTGIGLRAFGGARIAYSISTLAATTATAALTGGRIYTGAQTSVPNY